MKNFINVLNKKNTKNIDAECVEFKGAALRTCGSGGRSIERSAVMKTERRF